MDTLETAATQLAPALAAAARATHEQGLTAEAVAKLKDAGLLDIYRAPGTPWGAHIGVTRILARACASTAWFVTHCAEANRLIAKAGHSLTGVAVAAHGMVVPGAAYADWIVLRTGDRAMLIAAADAGLTSLNHVGGLRGCGFKSVNEASGRTLDLTGDEPFHLAGPLGAILGGAEGGYADYLAMTKKRVSGTGGGAVAKLTQVQIRLAEADAEIAAARTAILSVAARLQSGQTNDPSLARDGAMAAHRGLKAITQLVQQMGALGLAEFNPVQRHYRDIRAMATDARVNFDTYMAAYGRHALGVNDLPTPANAAE